MAGCDEGLTDRWISPSPKWSAKRQATLGYALLEFESPESMTFSCAPVQRSCATPHAYMRATDILSETGQAADTFTLGRPVPKL